MNRGIHVSEGFRRLSKQRRIVTWIRVINISKEASAPLNPIVLPLLLRAVLFSFLLFFFTPLSTISLYFFFFFS